MGNTADFGWGGWDLNPRRGTALNGPAYLRHERNRNKRSHPSKNKPITSTYTVLKWHAPVVKEDNQAYENNLKKCWS